MPLPQPGERKLHLPSQISVNVSVSVTDTSLLPSFSSPPQSCSQVFTEISSLVSTMLQEIKARHDACVAHGDLTGGHGNN